MLKKSWPFVIFAILAFALHFAFLSYPAQVVFDEVHFGKFVSAYFTGQYYFDIHPPLGKLIIAGWAKINGINPVFDFDHIGENIPARTLFILRFMPAFFGSLFVLAFAWLAHLISRSKKVALIAGFLILLDNAFLVQSKFILVDIFMIFFEILTLYFFFLGQRQKSFSAKWFIFLILTAVSFGLSISVKWTGLATIGIIGAVLIAKIFSKKMACYLSLNPASAIGKRIKESITVLAVTMILGFFVYLTPFAIHFNLLTKSGPGDAFMNAQFQKELKYGRNIVSHPLSFWQKFVELNKTMYTASAGITATHPYGSRWYAWPLDRKPVYYWNSNQVQPGFSANIYLAGNPVLWWLAGTAIAIIFLSSFWQKNRKNIEPIFYILILGYLANLLPFILIKRVSFLYHYLPAIMFGNMLIAFLLARLWPKEKKIFLVVGILILAGFILLAPLSYGLPTPSFLNKIPMFLVSALTQ